MNEEPNLYERFLAEREEIMKHKWIESEKQGYDIGFERALTDWMKNHRKGWIKDYNKIKSNTPDNSD
jgi:hypothetical protein